MRSFKAAGGLLVIMLLMASCLRVDGTITIEDDGSGSIDFLTALDAEGLTATLETFDFDESDIGETSELCDGFESEFSSGQGLPDGAVVTPYNEDGFCGSRVQYELRPSLDHSGDIEGILEPGTRLYKEGDNWFFESDFDSDDITSGTEGAPDAMVEALFADASFRLVVDLPGRAVEGMNNATEVGADGRFVWDVDILNPPARFFAQTEPGSGGGTGGGGGLNPIIIGVVVALLAAGLAFFLLNKRKNGTADTTDTIATPPGAQLPAAGFPTTQPVATAMPTIDGPPISATPTADAVKETVVMSAADVQQSIHDPAIQDPAIHDPAIQDPAIQETVAAAEPVFDEALNAWVIDDPTRGRLQHDPETDTWNPA